MQYDSDVRRYAVRCKYFWSNLESRHTAIVNSGGKVTFEMSIVVVSKR